MTDSLKSWLREDTIPRQLKDDIRKTLDFIEQQAREIEDMKAFLRGRDSLVEQQTKRIDQLSKEVEGLRKFPEPLGDSAIKGHCIVDYDEFKRTCDIITTENRSLREQLSLVTAERDGLREKLKEKGMNIPENVMAKLKEIIEAGDYEYADNFRAARTGNSQEMQEYAFVEAQGCCGSHEEITVIDGVEYQIGFNYGH